MPIAYIQGRPIKYEVKRHKGNRIFIEVRPDGLLLRLPEGLDKEPEEVIREHEAEILRRLSSFEDLERLAELHAQDLEHRLLLLGRFVDLRITICPKRHVRIDPGGVEVMAPSEEEAYGLLREHLKAMLKERASSLVEEFSAKLGVKPRGLRVVVRKRAWASLTGGNIITMALKTLALPPEYIRYVVAHEVAHLVRRSHDRVARALTKALVGLDIRPEELAKYEFLIRKCAAWEEILKTRESSP